MGILWVSGLVKDKNEMGCGLRSGKQCMNNCPKATIAINSHVTTQFLY